MPVVSRPSGERVLTLAVRTAMLNFVLVAGSANAWAAGPEQQDVAADKTSNAAPVTLADDSTDALTLDTTNINARYNGATALPETLAGGQVARCARLGMMGNK